MKTVAPYAGAWIEIARTLSSNGVGQVAPYAGAWIEIQEYIKQNIKDGSLPTRERGLKYACGRHCFCPEMSLPTRERGLKYYLELNQLVVLDEIK